MYSIIHYMSHIIYIISYNYAIYNILYILYLIYTFLAAVYLSYLIYYTAWDVSFTEADRPISIAIGCVCPAFFRAWRPKGAKSLASERQHMHVAPNGWLSGEHLVAERRNQAKSHRFSDVFPWLSSENPGKTGETRLGTCDGEPAPALRGLEARAELRETGVRAGVGLEKGVFGVREAVEVDLSRQKTQPKST